MRIHKEGRLFLTVLLVLIVLIDIGIYHLNMPDRTNYFFYGLSVLIFMFFMQFFRNPVVYVEKNPDFVLAPADGKVVVIEETDVEEYLSERRIQISIFMSPLDKHINRNPVSGIIKYFKYHPGNYFVAWNPKSSMENERTTIVYEMSNGIQILLRQIAGAAARRIKFYNIENDEVEQGEEFGFIKFGSRVDVFVPVDCKILVSLQEKAYGGKTVLAKLPDSS